MPFVAFDIISKTRPKGMSSLVVKMAMSLSELTLALPDTIILLASASDSTIMPLRDCATNLNRPGCPEIARVSANFIFSV